MNRRATTEMQRSAGREDGNITIFSLMTFVMIIGICGLAADTMYFEGKRVAAQDAMDRCALMAAITQNRIDGGATTGITAADVASDCMGKSAVGNAGLNAPVVVTQNSERSVTLTGNFSFAANFPMLSPNPQPDAIPTLEEAPPKTFAIASQSKQKLPNLELTIAMDINHDEYWASAKDKFKTFINTLAAPDTGNKMTVNIIPFNKNVFIGTKMMGQMGAQNPMPFANRGLNTCLVLPEGTGPSLGFDTASGDYSWSWPIAAEFIENGTYALDTYPLSFGETLDPTASKPYVETVEFDATKRAQLPVLESIDTRSNCTYPISTANEALFGAQVSRPINPSASNPIMNKIDGFVAGPVSLTNDANSVEALRWSLAAMDPSLRSIFTQNVADGSAAAAAAGRPLDYQEDDTLKVLVFATHNVFLRIHDGRLQGDVSSDAKATIVRELRPEFLDGTEPMPDIWRTPEPETATRSIRYSIRHPDAPNPAKPYWVTRDRLETTATGLAHWAAAPFQYPGGGAPVQQTWNQVFSKMTLSYLINELYVLPMALAGQLPANPDYHIDSLLNKFTYVAQPDSATQRSQFAAMCELAKQEGVLIYMLVGDGALLSASSPGGTSAVAARETYKNCATSPAHYFEAPADYVDNVLGLIASNIAQLNITQ